MNVGESNRCSGLYWLYFTMTIHSTGGSAADLAMPTPTQGHVKYSGKAVHRLGLNEGLSIWFPLCSHQIRLCCPLGDACLVLPAPCWDTRPTEFTLLPCEGLATGPSFASWHISILLAW